MIYVQRDLPNFRFSSFLTTKNNRPASSTALAIETMMIARFLDDSDDCAALWKLIYLAQYLNYTQIELTNSFHLSEDFQM